MLKSILGYTREMNDSGQTVGEAVQAAMKVSKTPFFDALSDNDKRFVRFHVMGNFKPSTTARLCGYKSGKNYVQTKLNDVNIQAALKEFIKTRTFSNDEIGSRLVNTASFDLSDYLTIDGRRIVDAFEDEPEVELADRLVEGILDAVEEAIANDELLEGVNVGKIKKAARKRERAKRTQTVGIDLAALVRDGYGFMIKSIKRTRSGDPIIEFRDSEDALLNLARIQGMFRDTADPLVNQPLVLDVSKLSTEQIKAFLANKKGESLDNG